MSDILAIAAAISSAIVVMAAWNCSNPCSRITDSPYVAEYWEPTTTLVLQLVIAALEQGTSIPSALRTVGECCGGVCAAVLGSVSDNLLQGVPWEDSWNGISIDEHQLSSEMRLTLSTLANVLRSSWEDGAAAIPQLRAASEQLDSTERMRIERAASALSVQLLLPMGLCFLPAFLCIAVIPTIISFAQG